MGPSNLMRHRADIWRPAITQGTGQNVGPYTKTYTSVPCFIQPASSQLQFFYAQRGTTVTHTIYTTDVTKTFLREDIFEDADGNQFHVVAAPLNALQSDIYLQLNCEQYTEGAKIRLNREAYS